VATQLDVNTGAGGGFGSVKQVGAGCLVDKFFATVVADLCRALLKSSVMASRSSVTLAKPGRVWPHLQIGQITG